MSSPSMPLRQLLWLDLPQCCWQCSSPCQKLLLGFQCLISLQQIQPSRCCVRLPNPGGPVSPSLWLTPNPRKFASRLCPKERTQGKGNQNTTARVAYRPLNFTSLLGSHFSSSESQNPVGITRRHSWLKCLLTCGRSLLSWLGVSTNEAMIQNLSWTPEGTADPLLKQFGPTKPLDSLAKAVLGNRIALDCLSAEQAGVCAVATTTCYTWI